MNTYHINGQGTLSDFIFSLAWHFADLNSKDSGDIESYIKLHTFLV